MEQNMLTCRQVAARIGLSRPQIYRMQKAGSFPLGKKLTAGRSGAIRWVAAEVDAWLASRPRAHAADAERAAA